MTAKKGKQRGRPAGNYPDTPEFQLLTNLFRSKIRANRFLEEHPRMTWERLMEAAREQIQKDREAKSTALVTMPGDGIDVAQVKEIITTLRDLSKTGFPVDEDAAAVADIIRKFPIARGITSELIIHAAHWSSHKIQLPYGVYDRKVLDTAYAISATLRTQTIPLETLMHSLARWFGFKFKGGKEYTRLKNSLRRLLSCSIRMITTGQHQNSELFSEAVFLLSGGNIPLEASRMAREEQQPLPMDGDWEIIPSRAYFFTIPDKVYMALTDPTQRLRFALWIPPSFLREFSHSAHEYDFAKFIACRTHECQTKDGTPIPMESLYHQFGNRGRNIPRWVGERREQLLRMRDIWPGCSAMISGNTLWIHPLDPGARFTHEWTPNNQSAPSPRLQDAGGFPSLSARGGQTGAAVLDGEIMDHDEAGKPAGNRHGSKAATPKANKTSRIKVLP